MELGDLVRQLSDDGARTILIDGRSGSGKSTLAERIRRAWDGSMLIRLDDMYPGWDGLEWTVEHVRTELLEPRADGRPGRWRGWDWATGGPAEWHVVEVPQRVIVEGVGALTAPNRALAELGIWVETEDAERKRRALLRDGETYGPHWDRWAAQEDVFMAQHLPQSVADWVLTETANGPVWTRHE